MNQNMRLRPKERDAILQSLRAGVVPRIGLHHIQVGRLQEVQALLRDIERIVDGGSTIRFIIGEYGSGKTFFMHLIRTIAMEKGLVTVHADLAPDRRIHATGSQSRNLYAELMRNMATRTKSDGGALPSVVERFVSSALKEARETDQKVEHIIHVRLEQMSEMVGGYDFAHVISAYWIGHDSGNEQLKSDAIRWLRGEFSTKTDARVALGVRTIVDDTNMYDHLKLMARFIRLAGYSGLLIGLDEMVNLYKLANTRARNSNYEKILQILNDCLQGIAVGIGFVMNGTPDFLMDTRRGLYSYAALHSRLEENRFAASAKVVDYSSPVIRLANLMPEDLFVLLSKIRHVFASGDTEQYLIPDEALKKFMVHCSQHIGEAYFRTPRNTIRSFVDLLSILEQNTHLSWQTLVGDVQIAPDQPADLELIADDANEENEKPLPSSDFKDSHNDELASFKL